MMTDGYSTLNLVYIPLDTVYDDGQPPLLHSHGAQGLLYRHRMKETVPPLSA